MGTCYSGLGSKSCSLSQTPIDPKVRPIDGHKSSQIEDNLKAAKESDFHHLSSSFENLSFSFVNELDAKMSSQPIRHKIPIPSMKTMANNKVVPKKSEEFVPNKYKTRRYEASVDVNKVMIFENSSTTSISSDCSLNLSKSSLKSTSSSTSNIGRPQTSIPKMSRPGNSRTPTPPIPVSNVSNTNQRNKLLQNSSSLINDRLNGNDKVFKNDHKMNKNKTIASKETSNSRPNREPSYGTSIKYTTQVSGLPRPQTAHIVSTSSHTSDSINHKINASNDIVTRVNHYSDQKSSNSRCDPTLRQIKPYFYGMNINNKPYERPLPLNQTNQYQTQSKPIANQPKLQFTSKFSQNTNQKQYHKFPQNSAIASNNYQNLVRDNSSNQRIVSNNNENHENCDQTERTMKNSFNDQTNHANRKSFENTLLPKSIQKMKDLGLQFKKTSKTNKSLETSPEHNSISSAGANSESDNRDFLIDDEICDQPELVLSSNIDKKDLMKNLNLELEGLLSQQQESSASPSTPTAPTSLSNASSTSTITPNTTFRKPRPLSLVEMADGSYGLDSPSLRAASQDLIGIKTLLFRLHGLLQNAETLNPFEHNYTQNKFYHQLIAESESNPKDISVDLQTENLDLKRQIVLQQQIIEDKDRTIRLLQQQMAKYSDVNNAYLPQTIDSCKVNASSQTDRCPNASNIDPRAVSDGSNGMLVSFWISKVPAFA